MHKVGAPAPRDIFTDNHRWGDLDEWNRAALGLHEQGGMHRITRDGFEPFWAVINHAAVLDIERQPELFTNGPEPVLADKHSIEARVGPLLRFGNEARGDPVRRNDAKVVFRTLLTSQDWRAASS